MTRRARSLLVCAPMLAGVTLLSACSGGPGGGPTAASGGVHPLSVRAVTARLGAVPIPSAPAAQPTPVASRQRPQLLAIGEPVIVDVPQAAGTVTTFGPVEETPYGSGGALPTSTVGVISVTATLDTGSLTLRAADFFSRDETGKVVSLAAAGPSVVTATPGRPARLRIEGTFRSGAAQVTWRYRGHVIVIWDFNIELD